MDLVVDLKPQTNIKGYYLCKYKQILKNKNGKDFHSLKLQDSTGIVDAKIWAIINSIATFFIYK